jgi:hypothetical protein
MQLCHLFVYSGSWRGGKVAIKGLKEFKEDEEEKFMKEVELIRTVRPHS